MAVLEQEFIVTNRQGIHARVATQIAKVAGQFESKITITKDGQAVDGKSILDVITLVCPYGCRLVVSVEGKDATEAMTALIDLFRIKFGEQ